MAFLPNHVAANAEGFGGGGNASPLITSMVTATANVPKAKMP